VEQVHLHTGARVAGGVWYLCGPDLQVDFNLLSSTLEKVRQRTILGAAELKANEESQLLVLSAVYIRDMPETRPKSAPDTTHDGVGPLRVLVICETFPHPNPAPDANELLRSLVELGHQVTFIARERLTGDDDALARIGIRIYADDLERVLVLGKPIQGAQSWNLEQLLSGPSFDIAILTDSFEGGLSIPEQYLDFIRQKSSGTRIVVWTHQLHQPSRPPTRPDRSELESFEKSHDWVSRQEEAFRRADLIVLANGDHELYLVSEREVRRLGKCGVEVVSDALGMALKTDPKSAVTEPFSIMHVEKLFPARLSSRSGLQRLQGQLEAFVTLASLLLKENRVVEARQQIRHVFSRMDGSWDAVEFVTQVIVLLGRCYRLLGDPEMSELCREAARQTAMGQWSNIPLALPKRTADAPRISLIVPTFNRLLILRKCLAALEAQTAPASDFEVIVVDDGSSDQSEEFLREYRPPFQFQYLRQQNSGTGAARRNGVAHANGEYLLLMNDDTICDPDVIEQHLQAHRKLNYQRWAVLGNFQYPAQARLRALTHYFCMEPFMFPQVSMEEGCPYGYSHFITCNLSVRRDAVMDVGSFASIYKLSEDTEMGLRLFEKGFRVLYHPAAHAWHDHLPYPARNLKRRSYVYGADYFHMFRRHPRVMREWAMPVPLTAMDEANALRILEYVEANRTDVENAMEALEKWDNIDFSLMLDRHPDTAHTVLSLFQQAVPRIHWFYLYEKMYQTMVRELNLVHPADAEPDVLADGAAACTKG